MAVAKVPSDAGEFGQRAALDLRQRFGCRHYLHQPPVFERQRIARTQQDSVRQVKQKRQPADAGHRHAPPVAVIIVKHDTVGSIYVPVTMGNYGCGAQHGETRIGGVGDPTCSKARRANSKCLRLQQP